MQLPLSGKYKRLLLPYRKGSQNGQNDNTTLSRSPQQPRELCAITMHISI